MKFQKAWGSSEEEVGPKGEVWTTYTQIGDNHFGIVLAAALDDDEVFSLSLEDAGFSQVCIFI